MGRPSCSPRIPGPAGALQEALRRGAPAARLEDGAGHGPEGERPADATRDVGTPPVAESPWFKLGAWRRLLDALDLERFDAASPLLRTNVGWILNGGWRGQRVHRLAAVIVDAFRTPFGDLKAVLADPTGAIRCTVSRDVVDLDPRAFRKGAALLLKDIPVLTVAEYTEHYLCVTPNELIQAFEPDEAGAAANEEDGAGNEARASEPRADFRLPDIEPRGEGRPAEELAREMHDAVTAVERAQAELDREREAEMAAKETREPEMAAKETREPEPPAPADPADAPNSAPPAEGASSGEVSAFALAAANLLSRR